MGSPQGAVANRPPYRDLTLMGDHRSTRELTTRANQRGVAPDWLPAFFVWFVYFVVICYLAARTRMRDKGSTLVPARRTDQCRCGPVTSPVAPTFPSISPDFS